MSSCMLLNSNVDVFCESCFPTFVRCMLQAVWSRPSARGTAYLLHSILSARGSSIAMHMHGSVHWFCPFGGAQRLSMDDTCNQLAVEPVAAALL